MISSPFWTIILLQHQFITLTDFYLLPTTAMPFRTLVALTKYQTIDSHNAHNLYWWGGLPYIIPSVPGSWWNCVSVTFSVVNTFKLPMLTYFPVPPTAWMVCCMLPSISLESTDLPYSGRTLVMSTMFENQSGHIQSPYLRTGLPLGRLLCKSIQSLGCVWLIWSISQQSDENLLRKKICS